MISLMGQWYWIRGVTFKTDKNIEVIHYGNTRFKKVTNIHYGSSIGVSVTTTIRRFLYLEMVS